MDAEWLARNMAAHWAQSGLLVMAVLIAVRLSRPGEPRLRLAALQLTLAATLVLPLLQPWRPMPASVQSISMAAAPDRAAAARVPAVVRPARPSRVDAYLAAVVVVLAGVALRLLWLCGGLLRLGRLRARAGDIPAPGVARHLEARLGVVPRYLEHREQASPAAFGVFGAAVVLPSTFSTFDVSMQQAIICHELIHVKRRDAAAVIIEELCVAFLWCHPWIWWLRSRIRMEREHAVDEQVVEHLGDRAGYVRCLVKMSGHDLAPHLSAGMLEARELRARIDWILEEAPMTRRSSALRLLALVVTAFGAAGLSVRAVPLRAQTMVDGAPNTFFHVAVPADRFRSPLRQSADAATMRRAVKVPMLEYPEGALAKGIGGAVFVDLAVNASGEVTTAAIVTGPDELRDAAFKAAMGVKFEPASATSAIRISVDYRIRSDSAAVGISWWDGSSTRRILRSTAGWNRDASAVVWEQNAVRRDVWPPRKLKDVAPEFPAAARAAGVQGIVVLDADVDEHGHVTAVRLLRSIPLLDEAAIDAVRQWQYEPTVESGTAVPVTITVTVNFTLRADPNNR